MNFDVTDCITVIGTRGTGKSTLARSLSKQWPRRVIIDPVSDWKDGDIVTSFQGFAQKLTLLKQQNAKKFDLIFRFNPDLSNKEEVLDHVLRLCFHFKNLQIIIDEVQLFSSPQYISNYLKNVLFVGRHQGLSLVAITQRPGQLNKSILAQSRHVFCGQLHERNDLKVISDFINIPTEKIINLNKGAFVWFSPGEKIREINIKLGKN